MVFGSHLCAACSRPSARVALGIRHQPIAERGECRIVLPKRAVNEMPGLPLGEDVVSDVFLAVWLRAGRLEGRAQVSTWLFGIARHKALSLLRSRTNDPPDDDVAESIEDPADNPEVTMQKEQRRTILQECLTQLSAAHI
jgi:RNA polymerase sigma factor (sigma-70 family)